MGVAVALAGAAFAKSGESEPLLAVLEFTNKLQGPDQVDAAYFSDVVRGEALDAAPGVHVITRENLLHLLSANQKSLADCEGECEVDTGRRIGADFVVSGELVKIGTTYHLSMKMHDTRSGDLLGVATASGKSVDELDQSTAQAARKLYAKLPPVPAGNVRPRAETPPASKPVAAVSPPPAPRQRAPAEATAAPPGSEAASAGTWRRAGYGILGAGLLAGAGSSVFALLGKSKSDSIKSGGFATSPAIVDAANAGQRDNTLALVCALAGGAAVAVAIPVILLHGEAQPRVAFQASPAGAALVARLP